MVLKNRINMILTGMLSLVANVLNCSIVDFGMLLLDHTRRPWAHRQLQYPISQSSDFFKLLSENILCHLCTDFLYVQVLNQNQSNSFSVYVQYIR